MRLVLNLPSCLVCDDGAAGECMSATALLLSSGLEVIGSWDDWALPVPFPPPQAGRTCEVDVAGSSLLAGQRFEYKFRSQTRFYYDKDGQLAPSGSGGWNNWVVVLPLVALSPQLVSGGIVRAYDAIIGSFSGWERINAEVPLLLSPGECSHDRALSFQPFPRRVSLITN